MIYMKKTTLIIMAAGLGSRYGGNKQVDGIGPHGEMLMQYSIYDAVAAGFDKIVFVVKKDHRPVIEAFLGGMRGAEVEFVYQDYSSIPSFYKIPDQRVKPFGTVHAVLCAKNAINGPFAVINADDFYGAEAFSVLHSALVELTPKKAIMVGYRLKNTVSVNGGVTRGICKVVDGKLSSVCETYDITVDNSGNIYDIDSVLLDKDSLVSMNMWGFSPDFMESAQSSFEDFLRGLGADELKAEYALPALVDKMIRTGELEIDVLSTESSWFGVTYKDDKPVVATMLEKLHKDGIYPEKLF